MKLSIITINLNNKDGLNKTIESVSLQTNQNFEYVVIDGGSTDGSLQVIEKYRARIDTWISEPDRGIYHAMNKGIVKARGEYLLFLNSGDLLYNDRVLTEIDSLLNVVDLLLFRVEQETREGKKIIQPDKDNFGFLIDGFIIHQGAVIKKELFNLTGYYNESLFLAADYEFFLKAIFKHECSVKILDGILVWFDGINGVSSQPENRDELYRQRLEAQKSVFDYRIVDALDKRKREVDELLQFRSKYEGLMASGSVKIALLLSKYLKMIFCIYKRKIISGFLY